MSSYSNRENEALANIRNRFPNTGQRTLARQIVNGRIADYDLRQCISQSGLGTRTFASVYGALRRLDKINANSDVTRPSLV